MKKYYATHLVKSEDLNHHGTLFAARTASWFVESAFIAAACEHGDPSEIVCRKSTVCLSAHRYATAPWSVLPAASSTPAPPA